MRKESTNLIAKIAGGVGAVAGYLAGMALLGHNPFNYIPLEKRVEEGYAKPSKIEIKLEDLDKDGQNETLLDYNGKSYLLMLDKNGTPVIQSYEVTPQQVVPKK